MFSTTFASVDDEGLFKPVHAGGIFHCYMCWASPFVIIRMSVVLCRSYSII